MRTERLTIGNNSLKLPYAEVISYVITCRSVDRRVDPELSDSEEVFDLLIS